jgi:hypothetical protein
MKSAGGKVLKKKTRKVVSRLARISHEEVAKGLVSWHNWFI